MVPWKLIMSFKNHYKAASYNITGLLIMFIFLAWLEFNEDAVFIFSICWVVYTIPVIYLHLEYYLRNRGEEYEIRNGELIQYRNGEERRFTKESIERIKVYMSASMYKGSSFQLLAIESYHYARIYLKSGEEIIITCLLAPKVEEAIKELNIPYQKKKRFFSTLSWK